MSRRSIAAGVMLLLASMAGACSAPAVSAVTNATPAISAGPMMDPERGVLTLAPLIEHVTSAVVNIATRSHVQVPTNPLLEDPFFRRFFNVPQSPRERQTFSAGSGVIIDAKKGYVLTNNHVIDKADEIHVTLRDRREFTAKLIGSDPETDVALLQIDADHLSELPFGDSDKLEVGDVVIAIGNPFGIGQTVTSGIVSALGRRGLGIEGYEDFIQTDASINPGNSGGALVNSKGELVGLNTAIIGPSGGNVGIGFAVPSNIARTVMQQLAEHGEVQRGRIGVAIQDLTPDLAGALHLERTRGAVVTQVEPDSPAARAGLEPGDVIVEVNGDEVQDSADLRNRVGLVQVGTHLDIKLVRNGREMSVEATVGRVQEATATMPQLAGATFRDIGPDSPMSGQGVVIAAIEDGSPASRYGLRQGDVVVAVNQMPVKSMEDLTRALADSPKAVVLNLVRGDTRMIVVIQ